IFRPGHCTTSCEWTATTADRHGVRLPGSGISAGTAPCYSAGRGADRERPAALRPANWIGRRNLSLGDLGGKVGRPAVWDRLPGLISDLKLDCVIVNGENAAGGFGITEDIFLETINAGADVVTTGNHVWDQKEAVVYADRHEQFLRPANYPSGTPGRGSGVYYARNGARILVANIMGRVFMHPELDDPFKSAEAILAACPLKEQADAVIFDFHAEATSEKQCFGHFVDGRASLVVGTHTHVPTADCQILNGGTGYMSDAGMCGDYDSSLGMDKE